MQKSLFARHDLTEKIIQTRNFPTPITKKRPPFHMSTQVFLEANT